MATHSMRVPQVALYVRDERPRVGLEVESLRMLGRDDELPQALVARALPVAECLRKIDAFLLGAEPAPFATAALCTLARQVRPMCGQRCAATIPGVGSLHGALLPARIHAADKRAAAAQPAPAQASAPSTAPRPSWRGRATAPMARGQPSGELQVIAGNRHHAAASTWTARLHGRINRSSIPAARPTT